MPSDGIRVEPGACGARPTIRGLRLTMDFVLTLLGEGYTADEIALARTELLDEELAEIDV